jgi:acetamidase/formamidase
MKLTLELMPSTAWLHSLHTYLTTKAWSTLRKKVLEEYNYQCAICGANGGQLNCNEQWEYNDETNTQRLVGLVMLCQMCHLTAHMMERGSITHDVLAEHFMRVELIWGLDAHAMIGRDQFGRTLALRPFMGVMGMPPDEPGRHPTDPPRFCGGNIDCKELVAGSTLYLPITVPEALFSVGDGHAVQGDGEVSGVAIECPMERVDLTFHLRHDMRLTTPRATTSTGWITLGFHENLHEASLIALEAMLDLMGEQYHLPRPQALALASLVVDLHVTQIANGVLGVHAVLPHEAIREME